MSKQEKKSLEFLIKKIKISILMNKMAKLLSKVF